MKGAKRARHEGSEKNVAKKKMVPMKTAKADLGIVGAMVSQSTAGKGNFFDKYKLKKEDHLPVAEHLSENLPPPVCDTPKPPLFISGWDPSKDMAWKTEVSDPAQTRVYAYRIDVPAHSDSVLAHWQDGTSHRVDKHFCLERQPTVQVHFETKHKHNIKMHCSKHVWVFSGTLQSILGLLDYFKKKNICFSNI